MIERPLDKPVTAQWETSYYIYPDDNLTRDVRVLIPSLVFGGGFAVSAVEPQPSIDPMAEVPGRVKVTATVSRKLYTVMIRFQQGAESFGDDPPAWALIEGSAVDVETGRTLGTGEVFDLS
jgi:hypothetical protein